MPRNGSGSYSLPIPPTPFVTGTTISAPDMNTTLTDIGTALTGSVSRDGQSPLTANWPVGGFNITGIGTLGATTLNVSGTATIGTLAGVTTLSLTTLTVTGAATVGTTLGVTGAITGSSTLTVTGAIAGGSVTSGGVAVLTSTKPTPTFSWGGGAVVLAGTYVFTGYAGRAGTVDALTYNVGTAGGSFAANVRINGTSVTGLSAVTVNSSTTASTSASGANTVAAGDRIDVVLSSLSGSPTDAFLTLRLTQ